MLTNSPPRTGTSRHTLLMAFQSAAGAAIVGYLVNLALLPFVIHRLGAELYGAWVTAAAFLIVGGLADAGIRVEIVRRVGAAHGEGDEEDLVRSVHHGLTLLLAVAGVFLVIGALGAPAFRSFAFPSGVRGLSSAELDWLIRGTFALLALSLVGNGYCGALKGLQRSDVEMMAQAVAAPFAAAITVVGIMGGCGIWSMLLALAGQNLVSLGWQYLRLRRLIPALRPRLARMSRRATQSFLTLSGLVLIGQLSDVIDSQWDKLILSHFVGSAAVASFQVGTSLVLAGKALVVVPLAPLLVAVAEFRNRERTKMELYFNVLAKSGMVLAAVVLGGIFVFAPAFVRVWLGSDVPNAGRAAQLFAIAGLLGMFSAPLSFRALGEGWHKLVAISAVVNMLVNGTASLAFTIWLGFYGPLYGSILGNCAGTVVLLALVRRRQGAQWRRPPLRAVGIGSVAALIFLAIGVDDVTTWPSLILAAIVWIVSVGFAAAAAERLPFRSLIRRGVTA